MLLLQIGALILGVAVVALIWLLDRPKDLGRLSDVWLRQIKRGDDR